MADSRLRDYATLLVDRCIDVQPGWQVLVRASPEARPLVEEVVAAIARRGAYALPRLSFSPHLDVGSRGARGAARRASPRSTPTSSTTRTRFMVIDAPENTRDGIDISPERLMLRRQAYRPHAEPFFAGEKPWVGCQFPTPALAQDAGMGLRAYEDFLYSAVLVDWEALGERMREIAAHFDAAAEVRITGDGTDLTFSLEGRSGHVDAIGANMPGGEVFYSPVEDSARGHGRLLRVPGVLRGPRDRERTAPLRGRPRRRRVGLDRRGLPAQDARHGRRRPRARRVRHRLQPRHPAAHAEHALRREDRGHDPSGPGQRLPVPGRHERLGRPLGHGQEPARARARSSSTARSCSATGAGSFERSAGSRRTRSSSSSAASTSSPVGRCSSARRRSRGRCSRSSSGRSRGAARTRSCASTGRCGRSTTAGRPRLRRTCSASCRRSTATRATAWTRASRSARPRTRARRRISRQSGSHSRRPPRRSSTAAR